MSEGQEDPTSAAKKMKKIDKSQASTNREYLDMDTDEEEYGRQETPEPEEVLELEPEKPIFTAEELNTLVRYIRDLTTLPSLTEADWSGEVVELVEEYFRSPANIVLTIFWEAKGKLKALLEFPDGFAGGLTYFLRSPWQVYTPDNFLSTVIFGSINDGVNNSILKFMENIYAPIAFDSEEWPTVVRNALFSNLHEFLQCLTDATYNPLGLTIFYVPREALDDDKKFSETQIIEKTISEEGVVDEGLLERLERVARYWIRQIREAIRGTNALCTSSSPWKTIVDEIHYWHYRYENLSCVYQQLTSKSVLCIDEKLESVRSSSVKQFHSLVAEVDGNLEEAVSNIQYLNLLEESSKDFDIPDGVEEFATRIALLIRFVGRESPFYKTREKIEILCRAFCVQAVEHFRKFIDLDLVLEGDPRKGREMLVKCIVGCNKLSLTYDRLTDMDENSDMPTISLVDKSKVFNHVDTLVHRCNDLIGIADARIAFDKCEESITYCGSKGLELGLLFLNIEERFKTSLGEIKNARDIILDFASATWLDCIVAFRRDIRDIENMVKNWIDDIFMDVLNVEEGIEALHGIARFSRRSHLRETLNNNWIQIWKIFGDELESCNVDTNEDSVPHHPALPPFSGQANILRSNKIYLTGQHKMLIDASDWFGDCDAQAAVTRKYKRVLVAISGKENQLFSETQEVITDKKINSTVIWNLPIIKYHNNGKARTITTNLQMFHLEHIREIEEWTLLNYDMKNILPKDCPKWEKIQLRYNKTEYLCKMYNSIVATVANRERFLFATLLEELEETLTSGFKKITWASDSIERFFTDCIEIIMNIRESVEFYRSINRKIDDLIERIAITSLMKTDNRLQETLKDSFDAHFEQQRCDGLMILRKNFKMIVKLLLKLKNKIHTDEAQMAQHWNDYINRIYERLKNSFTNCIRLSLLCALQFLRDDEALIITNRVSSKLQQTERAIGRINASALESALPIEEFAQLFETSEDIRTTSFLDSIDQDTRSIDLRKEINEFYNI